MISKRFHWNAKYETVYRWLASFIVIYTTMNLKSWHPLRTASGPNHQPLQSMDTKSWHPQKTSFLSSGKREREKTKERDFLKKTNSWLAGVGGLVSYPTVCDVR